MPTVEIPDPIVFDYSTLSTFSSCQEKARLSYVEGLDVPDVAKAANYGTAIHSALEVLDRGGTIEEAERALVRHLRDDYPVSIDDDERRSIERAVSLVHAYQEKWGVDHLETITNPKTGEPLLETSFMFELFRWRGRPVFFAGKLDRCVRSRTNAGIYLMERKTTTSGLGSYLGHTRPNHQLSGYYYAVERLLGIQLSGVYWDCIYISDRKCDPKKGGWFAFGIDIEKDFGRELTLRTERDLDEWLYDMRLNATQYLDLWAAGLPRWVRNAPGACFDYGGCKFLPACKFHLNENVMKTFYVPRRWSPLKDDPKLPENGGHSEEETASNLSDGAAGGGQVENGGVDRAA